jgi:hypothetical protein
MPNVKKEYELISRREMLQRVTTMLGGVALVGQGALLAALEEHPEQRNPDARLFSQKDIAWLDEVAETILPETRTPGAKAAAVGAFMALMVTDTYDPEEQQVFLDGMRTLEEASAVMHGQSFISTTADERLQLLEKLDVEQKEFMDNRGEDTSVHYFRMMKELTLLGYFTSEIGCTQAMRYIESPGRYDPCVPYTPGEKTWARHA